MDAALLAALAGVVFGGMAVALRLGLARFPDVELGALHSCLIGFLVSVVVTAAAGRLEHARLSDIWPFLALGVLVPGASQTLLVRGVRDIGASRTMLITGTAPLLSTLAAIVLLGEPVRAGLVLGALLVVVGVATLAWERRRPPDFRAIGVLWVAASLVFFVVRDIVSRWATDGRGAPPLASATALLGAASVTLLAYVAVARRAERPLSLIRRSALPFLAGGVLFGLGYDALLEAFARGRVTVVAPLNGTYAFWAVVFSALLLHRSELVGRRLVLAALLIVGGSALVAGSRDAGAPGTTETSLASQRGQPPPAAPRLQSVLEDRSAAGSGAPATGRSVARAGSRARGRRLVDIREVELAVGALPGAEARAAGPRRAAPSPSPLRPGRRGARPGSRAPSRARSRGVGSGSSPRRSG